MRDKLHYNHKFSVAGGFPEQSWYERSPVPGLSQGMLARKQVLISSKVRRSFFLLGQPTYCFSIARDLTGVFVISIRGFLLEIKPKKSLKVEGRALRKRFFLCLGELAKSV